MTDVVTFCGKMFACLSEILISAAFLGMKMSKRSKNREISPQRNVPVTITNTIVCLLVEKGLYLTLEIASSSLCCFSGDIAKTIEQEN